MGVKKQVRTEMQEKAAKRRSRRRKVALAIGLAKARKRLRAKRTS